MKKQARTRISRQSRSRKRLQLARTTIRHLQGQELVGVVGGDVVPPSVEPGCTTC